MITHMQNIIPTSNNARPASLENFSGLPENMNSDDGMGTLPSRADEYAGMPSSSQDQEIHKIQELDREDVATTLSHQEIYNRDKTEGPIKSYPSTDAIFEESDCGWKESIGLHQVSKESGDNEACCAERSSHTTRMNMELSSTSSCHDSNEVQEEVDRVVGEIMKLCRKPQGSECEEK
ncbi:hypothetical protein QAD02_011938 [Eretmocerus hayati]|uniref:Uncharacterized protein n=1 Tax=Eretmocerus hayati TaxID=131215 RepID=A0ACC2P124_9HYME|nr:hypothetical protein QAD02_011938 [Eretmocerus hayati]